MPKLKAGDAAPDFTLPSADGSPVTASDAAWSINRAKDLEGGWGFLMTPVTSVTASVNELR